MGILVTLAGEYQINILIHQLPVEKYLMVFVVYSLLVSIFYIFGKFLDKKFLSAKADLIYYFVAGFVGLAFEWFVIGNSLYENPSANQAGMFCWWTAVFLIPRIFTKTSNPDLEIVKKKIYYVLIPYSIISLIIVSLIPADPVMARIAVTALAMIFSFVFVNYYLIRYLISQNPHLKKKLTYFYIILVILALVNLF